MELKALAYLILSKPCCVGDIAAGLDITEVYASNVTDRLAEKGLVLKKRDGKRVIVEPNPNHPFTLAFRELIHELSNISNCPALDLVTPESRIKVLHSLLEGPRTRKELEEATGYSWQTIYGTISIFKENELDIISKTPTKIKKYYLNHKHPLTKTLVNTIKTMEVGTNGQHLSTPLMENLPVSSRNNVLLHLSDSYHLERNDVARSELTQSGISRTIGADRSTISRVIKELEKQGCINVMKMRVKGCKRMITVYMLTPLGFRRAEKLKEEIKHQTIMIKDEEDNITPTKISHLLGKLRFDASLLDIIQNVDKDGVLEMKKLRESVDCKKTQYIYFAENTPVIRYFFGREHELKLFDAWMDSNKSKILVVEGIAGIGKSAFLIKAIEKHRKNNHIFWHRLGEFSTLKHITTHLADFLYLLNKKRLKMHLQTRNSLDVNDISVILEKELKNVPMLLIFDDYQKVKDSPEITYLFGKLADILKRTDNVKLVVDGREVPRFNYDERDVQITELVQEMNLHGLDRETSYEFLSYRGVTKNEHTNIYRLTRGHPLCLELVIEVPKFKPDIGINRFVEEEIFPQLYPQERKILDIASLFRHPVPGITYIDIAQQTINQGSEERTGLKEINYELISSLHKKSLLYETEGAYGAHDLIKSLFSKRLSPSTKRTYHKAIANYYRNWEDEKPVTYIETMYHFVQAKECTIVNEMIIQLGQEIIEQGYWQELLGIIEKVPIKYLASQQKPVWHLIRGRCYQIQGSLEKALFDYTYAAEAYNSIGDKVGEARAIIDAGHVYWTMDEFDQSLDKYYKALEICEITKYETGISKSHRGIGRAYWRKGDLNTALEELESALKHTSKEENNEHTAVLFGDLACVLHYLGENKRADEYFKKSMSRLKEIDSKYELSRVYCNYAGFNENLHQYSKTVENAEKAIQISEEIGFMQGIAHGLANAAVGYMEINNLDKALEYCQKIEALTNYGLSQNVLATLNNIYGKIYHKKGEWKLSETHFDKALEITMKIELPMTSVNIHLSCMSLFRDKGDLEKAIYHLKTAKELAEKLGNKELIDLVEQKTQEPKKVKTCKRGLRRLEER